MNEIRVSRCKPLDIKDTQVEAIYRNIMMNYEQGCWEIAVDDLRELLSLSQGLSKIAIQNRVLKPICDIIRKRPLCSELKCYSLWSRKDSFTNFLFQW